MDNKKTYADLNGSITDIKFRVWDYFNGVYRYSKDFKNLAEFFIYCQKCVDGGNDLVLERYFGEVGRNKIEVYENDILATPCSYTFYVKKPNVHGLYGKTKTIDSVGNVILKHTRIGFAFRHINREKRLYDINNMVVIGNINQNKELLGQS